jgi:hypothetical protein
MGASQEQFRKPLCGRGEEARHRGLVFDEFLNRIIHRGRVEVVFRAGLVGGELVNNAAAGSIPQKGDIFIPCRCGSYPVGCFIVRFAPVGSHFHKESGETQSDPMVQELQYPSDDIAIFGGVESWVFTRSHPVF